MRGTRQTSRLAFGLIAILVVALIINLLVGQPSDGSRIEVYRKGSSYASGHEGAELTFRLFEGIGFEVDQLHHPLLEAYVDADRVDVIWHFRSVNHVGSDEVDWIERWVNAGGTLVLIDDPQDEVAAGYEARFAVEDALISTWLDLTGLAASLRRVVDLSGRATAHSNRNLTHRSILMALGEMGPVSTYARGSFGDSYVARFVQPEEISRGPEIVISDAHGIILAREPYGKGQVWFVADPMLFSNMLIQEADNAPVAVSMIAESRGGESSRILFDEYHLGFVQTRSFVDAARTPVGKALLYLGLVAVLAVGSAGARFGRARSAHGTIGVSQRAFVRALAGLWQAGGATEAAAGALWKRYQGNRSVRQAGLADELDKMREGHPRPDELLMVARKLDS